MPVRNQLLRLILRVPVRFFGIARQPRVVRLLRDLGLYTPLRLVYDEGEPRRRRRYRELRAFRRRYGSVLAAVRTTDDPRCTVLFPHVGAPGLDRLRVDAMIAKGLQAVGGRPLFLVDRHDLWHEEHLRAFGFRDFVFVDDHLPQREAFAADADRLLAECETQEDVLALTFGGYEIGRHAASGALKLLRRGTADPTDGELAAVLRFGLSHSMRYAHAADAVLDEVRPTKLVSSVQNYTPWAEFFEGALRRGVDVVHWGRSHLENAFLFHRYTYGTRHDHFVTISDETWEQLKQRSWTAEDGRDLLDGIRQNYLQPTWLARKGLVGKRAKRADEIRAELGLDPAKKTAFIFSHLLYDATFWFGRNLYRDYAVWLQETVAAAIENPALNWVVKLHPENVRRWRQATGHYELSNLEEVQLLNARFGALPDHVRLMPPENDTSTVSLFDFADFVLTVRGTVGLEFPCFGVPVVTAGEGAYSGRGFTVDPQSPEEYVEVLRHLHELPRLDPHATELAQRFAAGVLLLKPLRMSSFSWMLKPEEEHDPGLSAWGFELFTPTPEALLQAPDLRKVATWVVDSADRDLMGGWDRVSEHPLGEPARTSVPF